MLTKIIIREALVFSAGALIGGFVSYNILKKRFNEELQEETRETREYARNRIAEYKQRAEIAEEVFEKLQAVEVEEEEEINPEEAIDEYDPSSVLSPPEDTPEVPYLIDEDTYNDHIPYNTKEVLLYYSLSGTLATDTDEQIDDPRQCVGDVLEDIVAAGTPWKVFYVRNPLTSHDYEVNNLLARFEPD